MPKHPVEPDGLDERSINMSHLITLSLIAEYGSFSRAAEAMNVSQPTVSQQIRELERHVGLPVAITQGRSIKLTDIGRELAAIGRRVALERARALRLAESHLSGTAGKLIVAASMTTSTYILPAIIGRLGARLPDATIELRVANTFDVAQMVYDDLVDLGVIEGQIDRPELSVTQFARDTLTCIAPAAFRAGSDTLSPHDVADQTLLVREDGRVRVRS